MNKMTNKILTAANTVVLSNRTLARISMARTMQRREKMVDQITTQVLPEFSTRVIAALEKEELVMNDWSLNRTGVVLRLHRIAESLFDGEQIEEDVFYDVERKLINGAIEALNC